MSGVKSLIFLLWILALLMAGWVFSRLPLNAIVGAIGGLSFDQWLAWIALNLIIIALMTWRWHLLIRAFRMSANFWQVLKIRQAGQVVSFLTPGPQFGGEPLQVYWLWKGARLPVRTALLSLGLDRFFELWVNFSVLFLAMTLVLATTIISFSNWQGALPALGLILLALTVLGWVLLAHPRWLVGGLQKLTERWCHHRYLQHVDAHWEAMGDDLEHVANTKRPALINVLAISLLGWACLLAELWLLLVMLNMPLTFAGFMVILMATRLAFLLPLPGGIGTLEAAIYWSFQSLDLPAEGALGLIALMRLRDALILVAGLICLRSMKQIH